MNMQTLHLSYYHVIVVQWSSGCARLLACASQGCKADIWLSYCCQVLGILYLQAGAPACDSVSVITYLAHAVTQLLVDMQ